MLIPQHSSIFSWYNLCSSIHQLHINFNLLLPTSRAPSHISVPSFYLQVLFILVSSWVKLKYYLIDIKQQLINHYWYRFLYVSMIFRLYFGIFRQCCIFIFHFILITIYSIENSPHRWVVASTVVDRGFEPLLGQSKDLGNWYFLLLH